MNLPPFSPSSLEPGEKEKSKDLLQILSVTEKLRNPLLLKSKQNTYLCFWGPETQPDTAVAFGLDRLPIMCPLPKALACALSSVLCQGPILEGRCQEASKLKYFLAKIYLSHFPDIATSYSPATIVFIYSKCIYFHSLLVFVRTGHTQGEVEEQSKALRTGVHRCLVSAAPLNTQIWDICPKLLRSVYKPNNDKLHFS